MRVHRPSSSFAAVTGPQQPQQRPPISAARAGPGARSSDARSSKCRQWSKFSFAGIPKKAKRANHDAPDRYSQIPRATVKGTQETSRHL